jgi:hypothetical protein
MWVLCVSTWVARTIIGPLTKPTNDREGIDMTRSRLLKNICVLIAGFILSSSTYASERRVSGTIIEVDCGDGTNFAVRKENGRRLLGVCYEKWCEDLCAENAASARNRIKGKKFSFSVRVTNIGEPSSGSLANEFYNMTLE